MRKKKLIDWLKSEIEIGREMAVSKATKMITLEVRDKESFQSSLIELAYWLGAVTAYKGLLDRIKNGVFD